MPPVVPPPRFESSGPAGPHCPNCNAALAPDQRYCLNCGQRLAEPRVDFKRELGLTAATEPAGPGAGQRESRGAVFTISAIAAILLALGVGIVIGRGNNSPTAAKPQIVTVSGGAAPTAASGASDSGTAVGSVSEDWPSSKSGYTVEVAALDKSSSAADVASAKSSATGKGATAVGVLDGDRHAGTPAGKYVIYSGQYTSKAQAQAAAAKLKKTFPGALVLHVTPGTPNSGSGSGSSSSSSNGSSGGGNANQNTGAIQAIAGLHGTAAAKASAKLPSTIGTGGAPPPKDNKKAGGGTSGTCIGC